MAEVANSYFLYRDCVQTFFIEIALLKLWVFAQRNRIPLSAE